MKKVLITLPIYNEEKIIYKNTNQVIKHIKKISNYNFKINLVCNGCTDDSEKVAYKLKKENPKLVKVDSIDKKGRGHALKYSWEKSDADILCYMDMDLATSLKNINDLVEKIDLGYDICIGSRYINKSKVKRDLLRLLLSKIYNHIVIKYFDLKVHDIQCGFKAISKKTKKIIKKIKDNEWFFDTELLITAKKEDLKIIEIPITWTENKNSKISFIHTPIYFLKKILEI